jgi:hypothetical protein
MYAVRHGPLRNIVVAIVRLHDWGSVPSFADNADAVPRRCERSSSYLVLRSCSVDYAFTVVVSYRNPFLASILITLQLCWRLRLTMSIPYCAIHDRLQGIQPKRSACWA